VRRKKTSPNKQIPDDKKEMIPKLLEQFSRRYVADVLNLSVDTVRKYVELDNKKEGSV
jgi:hypothetical protein